MQDFDLIFPILAQSSTYLSEAAKDLYTYNTRPLYVYERGGNLLLDHLFLVLPRQARGWTPPLVSPFPKQEGVLPGTWFSGNGGRDGRWERRA